MASKQEAVRKGRKPVEVVIPAGLEAEAKKQLANDKLSKCAAIRNVAKKYAKHRGAVVKVLSGKGFNIPKGTVQTQFQLARASA